MNKIDTITGFVAFLIALWLIMMLGMAVAVEIENREQYEPTTTQ